MSLFESDAIPLLPDEYTIKVLKIKEREGAPILEMDWAKKIQDDEDGEALILKNEEDKQDKVNNPALVQNVGFERIKRLREGSDVQDFLMLYEADEGIYDVVEIDDDGSTAEVAGQEKQRNQWGKIRHQLARQAWDETNPLMKYLPYIAVFLTFLGMGITMWTFKNFMGEVASQQVEAANTMAEAAKAMANN